MGPSRQAMTCITGIMSAPTTSWQISRSFSAASIMSTTTQQENHSRSRVLAVANQSSGESGVVHRSVPRASIGRRRNDGWSSRRAAIADQPSDHDAATFAVSVASTWAPAGEAAVYDLAIDGAHEFYANGILVHNCDEVGAWRYPEAFDQAMFGLRLGNNPQVVVTTTPRPTALIRDLLARPGTVVRRGSTYDNRDNLAEAFYTDIIRKYEGTRLGRQELNAELLTDTPGALWTRDLIRLNRAIPDLARVVVAVDPSGGDEPENDEVGIVVAGRGKDQRGYILADESARYSPDGWARKAVALFDSLQADRIVAEANFGGAMVESTLRTVRRDLPITLVHASRGKAIRAEPIAALYEQHKVDHADVFPQLEDELCTWTPLDKRSPNRLDALVWAMSDLFRRQGEPSMAFQDGVRI
jgi:hypothetical protein